MSSDRVIPAQLVDPERVEAFPYFAAQFTSPVLADEEAPAGDDRPISSALTTPEEDARRLASAEQQIYEKLQHAEREAQDIARRAFEEGFQAGEAEGRTFGEAQYLGQIQRLEGHLKELSASLALNAEAAQDELVALALAAAEHLAARELEGGKGSVLPLLRTLLEGSLFPAGIDEGPGRASVTVRLNRRDLEALGPEPGLAGVQLRADESLSRGSLLVESADGLLDATLETRRDRLMERLAQRRERGEA